MEVAESLDDKHFLKSQVETVKKNKINITKILVKLNFNLIIALLKKYCNNENFFKFNNNKKNLLYCTYFTYMIKRADANAIIAVTY